MFGDCKRDVADAPPHLIVDPERMSKTKGVLFSFLAHVHMLIDPISHLPCDGQVILSFTAGSNHHVTLVHGLHHLLCLFEVDVVERRVGNHTFDVSCGKSFRLKFILQTVVHNR